VGEEDVIKPHRLVRTRSRRPTEESTTPEAAHRVQRQEGGRQKGSRR